MYRQCNDTDLNRTNKPATPAPRDDMHDYTDLMEDSMTQDSDDGFKTEDAPINNSSLSDKRKLFNIQLFLYIIH